MSSEWIWIWSAEDFRREKKPKMRVHTSRLGEVINILRFIKSGQPIKPWNYYYSYYEQSLWDPWKFCLLKRDERALSKYGESVLNAQNWKPQLFKVALCSVPTFLDLITLFSEGANLYFRNERLNTIYIQSSRGLTGTYHVAGIFEKLNQRYRKWLVRLGGVETDLYRRSDYKRATVETLIHWMSSLDLFELVRKNMWKFNLQKLHSYVEQDPEIHKALLLGRRLV